MASPKYVGAVIREALCPPPFSLSGTLSFLASQIEWDATAYMGRVPSFLPPVRHSHLTFRSIKLPMYIRRGGIATLLVLLKNSPTLAKPVTAPGRSVTSGLPIRTSPEGETFGYLTPLLSSLQGLRIEKRLPLAMRGLFFMDRSIYKELFPVEVRDILEIGATERAFLSILKTA